MEPRNKQNAQPQFLCEFVNTFLSTLWGNEELQDYVRRHSQAGCWVCANTDIRFFDAMFMAKTSTPAALYRLFGQK